MLEHVAVAAAEMKHRFDLGVLLDQLAGDLRAQTGAGARPVRHVDAIDAVRPCTVGAPSISFDASTPRGGRISTNATNFPAASFAASLRFLGYRNFGQRLAASAFGSSHGRR